LFYLSIFVGPAVIASLGNDLGQLSFTNASIEDLKWKDVPRLLEEYQAMARELERLRNEIRKS
jgi:hypothetical protein